MLTVFVKNVCHQGAVTRCLKSEVQVCGSHGAVRRGSQHTNGRAILRNGVIHWQDRPEMVATIGIGGEFSTCPSAVFLQVVLHVIKSAVIRMPYIDHGMGNWLALCVADDALGVHGCACRTSTDVGAHGKLGCIF